MSRRRRLLTRALPLALFALVAFVAGIVVAGGPTRSERRLALGYARAWVRGDMPRMYRMLDAASRAQTSETAFAADVRDDEQTATVRSMTVIGARHVGGGTALVAMAVHTRLWGTLDETLALPLAGSGSAARIRLQSSMLFPGLRSGEALSRQVRLPVRGTLLAADRTPLAQGAARTSPDPAIASPIVGTLGPIPAAERAHYAALGYPPGTQIGLDGLEEVFQNRLAGRLGGSLLAGARTLASVAPRGAAPVRTTIVPALETAVLDALGNHYAGMIVMNPRTGAVQALAGLAYNAPQPPGSTMKMVTATAVLENHLATLTTDFGYLSGITIDGYTIQNDSGETCGGTLLYAFATSCNSVYAPLGVRVGARRLVATAERFGFNHTPALAGALPSTIPSAATIGSALSVGSSAIGQGKVLATPLEMDDVAATMADGGRRPIPTLLAGARPRYVRVTSPAVAREVQQMMVAVITEGTGAPAAIPGVVIAGKTGTAELTDTASKAASSNPKNTDSWFVAYGPVGHAKVSVAALFPGAGYGAATAAPAVRSVIEAALAR